MLEQVRAQMVALPLLSTAADGRSPPRQPPPAFISSSIPAVNQSRRIPRFFPSASRLLNLIIGRRVTSRRLVHHLNARLLTVDASVLKQGL